MTFIKRHFLSFFLLLLLYQCSSPPSNLSQNQKVEFIKKGKNLLTEVRGQEWHEEGNYLKGAGKHNILHAGKYIEDADFELSARLSLDTIGATTALLWFFDNHFGFDSNHALEQNKRRLFLYSPVLDSVLLFGKSEDYFTPGKPFDFRLRRADDSLSFSIDQREIVRLPKHYFKQPLRGVVGWRPWRNTMKIEDFSIRGHLTDFPKANYIFGNGEQGYKCFRIPTIIRCPSGTLLAFAEGRQTTCQDNGNTDIVLKRSTDEGKHWGPLELVQADGANTCGYPTPVIDQKTGKLMMVFVGSHGSDHHTAIYQQKSIDTRRIYLTYSEDEGKTWSKRKEMTNQVKKSHWTYYGLGYTSALQLRHPPFTDRILIAAYHGEAGTDSNYVHLIYSDDFGQNWQIGADLHQGGINETELLELDDGRIYLTIRNDFPQLDFRQKAISNDGGLSIEQRSFDEALNGPMCQASLLGRKTEDGRFEVFFANPDSKNSREFLSLRSSDDRGTQWQTIKLIHRGYAAYSDLIELSNGQLACIFECGKTWPYEGIAFKTIQLKD
ncbi:MAG: sialidase family protein [Bacteroidota bacterium]